MEGYHMLEKIYEVVNRLEEKMNARIDNVDGRLSQLSNDKAASHKEIYKEIALVGNRLDKVAEKIAVYDGKASMFHVVISGIIAIGSFIISLITFFNH